ncbi:MAG: M20 family metallo-hydrolase [Flavobacteriaceae bacterium]|nr:M20 family metallo-hydrolase [Flavobacteriaceae bacterium]MDG2315172.1 M20 family metallo-hydrolase [Flavobacteriaceae bacterium]
METNTQKAIQLLQDLISIQSFSSQEDQTANRIEEWFKEHKIPFKRSNNNVYAFNHYFDKSKPTLLLNSHHDTVRPNRAYTRDPYQPDIVDGKLYGLGSNDAGGALVSLIAVFTHFYAQKDLNYNLVMVASAEEESSGKNGLNSVLPLLPTIDVAIVGEPTLMKLAISEKGLVVFDVKVKGTAGHAAHPNDNNPILKSIEVLQWLENFTFDRSSETLGDVKLTVTQINAGSQHNVVPAEVHIVVDVRVNDQYTNQEITDLLQAKAPCEITPRSLRLNSSSIPKNHPLVKAGMELNRPTYGSPTLSDQSVLSCPSLKLGPGDSTRSHTADEYIFVDEINEAINLYTSILNKIL